MIYKMELSDSFDTMVFDLLEVPIEDRDVTGIASNTTIDGNVFNDYLWLKKQYVQKWSIMCQDEYERLRGFWTRQFGNAEVPFYRLFYGKNDYEERSALTVDGYTQLENPTERLAPLSLTHLYGNATQETLSGKNLYDFTDTNSVGTHTTASADGKITTTLDNTGGSATVYDNYYTRPSTLLGTSTNYYIVCEIFNISVTSGDPMFQMVNTQGGVNQFTTGYTKRFSEMNAGDVIVFQATTRSDFSPCNTMLRTFCAFSVGQSGSITYRISVQKEATTASTFVYEPFVGGSPMPNPQFPSEIETVTGGQTVKITGKNLFDKSSTPISQSIGTTVSELPTGIRASTTVLSTYRNVRYSTGIKLSVGQTITLSANIAPSGTNNGRIALATCDANGNNRTTAASRDYSGSISYTLTEDKASTPYIQVYLYSNLSSTTVQASDYIDYTNLQLELGSQKSDFEPYQSQSQEINLGKNLADPNNANIINAYIRVAGITAEASNRLVYYKVEQDSYYTISATRVPASGKESVADNMQVALCSDVPANGVAVYDVQQSPNLFDTTLHASFTVYTGSHTYLAFKYANITNTDASATLATIQLERGNKETTFSPYKTPIELAKIGTYQGYIWNDNGTWKIHKAINKIVLKGTENWALGPMFYCTSAIPSTVNSIAPTGGNIKSDYYTYSGGATNDPSIDIVNGYILRIKDSSKADVSALTTWLGTHNVTVYYPLATPTDTEITDSGLIEQLNHIYSLYQGTNNLWLVPSAGAQGEMEAKYRLIYDEETDIIPQTPVVLTLSDGGVINPCGCRQNVQLTMRETKESSEI